jgi:hypothetical protein
MVRSIDTYVVRLHKSRWDKAFHSLLPRVGNQRNGILDQQRITLRDEFPLALLDGLTFCKVVNYSNQSILRVSGQVVSQPLSTIVLEPPLWSKLDLVHFPLGSEAFSVAQKPFRSLPEDTQSPPESVEWPHE